MFDEERAEPVRILKALLKLSQKGTKTLRIKKSIQSLQNLS